MRPMADTDSPAPESPAPGPAPEPAPEPVAEPAPESPAADAGQARVDSLSDATRYCTTVTVGVMALTWDRVAGRYVQESSPARQLPNIAVGVLFDAEDAAFAAASTVGRLAAVRPRRPRLTIIRGGSMVSGLTNRMNHLAERGAAETDRGRKVAATAATDLAQRAATSPVVNGAVDAQLDRLLRPLVAVVLDDVMAVLSAEPERVRALIRDQSESITEEVVARIRGGAVAGDAAVQGLVSRLLSRPRQSSKAAKASPAAEAPEAEATEPATPPTTPPAAPPAAPPEAGPNGAAAPA